MARKKPGNTEEGGHEHESLSTGLVDPVPEDQHALQTSKANVRHAEVDTLDRRQACTEQVLAQASLRHFTFSAELASLQAEDDTLKTAQTHWNLSPEHVLHQQALKSPQAKAKVEANILKEGQPREGLSLTSLASLRDTLESSNALVEQFEAEVFRERQAHEASLVELAACRKALEASDTRVKVLEEEVLREQQAREILSMELASLRQALEASNARVKEVKSQALEASGARARELEAEVLQEKQVSKQFQRQALAVGRLSAQHTDGVAKQAEIEALKERQECMEQVKAQASQACQALSAELVSMRPAMQAAIDRVRQVTAQAGQESWEWQASGPQELGACKALVKHAGGKTLKERQVQDAPREALAAHEHILEVSSAQLKQLQVEAFKERQACEEEVTSRAPQLRLALLAELASVRPAMKAAMDRVRQVKAEAAKERQSCIAIEATRHEAVGAGASHVEAATLDERQAHEALEGAKHLEGAPSKKQTACEPASAKLTSFTYSRFGAPEMMLECFNRNVTPTEPGKDLHIECSAGGVAVLDAEGPSSSPTFPEGSAAEVLDSSDPNEHMSSPRLHRSFTTGAEADLGSAMRLQRTNSDPSIEARVRNEQEDLAWTLAGYESLLLDLEGVAEDSSLGKVTESKVSSLWNGLNNVAADALQHSCDRMMPGSMDIFEHASTLLERLGALMQSPRASSEAPLQSKPNTVK
eukprot:gnl/TRDRNA2_/TRDRNA2_44874_c0_seq1.p1 gnl/TRDRNA2_/TRDRNA2_44874_c0~~gnl/TRDRNA2_/TRDRNA2_44874_c0_seq1.p1  ORF type:complete len:705 (+),score=148.38 gnl/TRDRNA2_/TRDRNA2_44874_c0_seq1:107-2221(+)